jgi:hypothetical protein
VSEAKCGSGKAPILTRLISVENRLRNLKGNLTATITDMNKLMGNAIGALPSDEAEDLDEVAPSDSPSQVMAVFCAHPSRVEYINDSTKGSRDTAGGECVGSLGKGEGY